MYIYNFIKATILVLQSNPYWLTVFVCLKTNSKFTRFFSKLQPISTPFSMSYPSNNKCTLILIYDLVQSEMIYY